MAEHENDKPVGNNPTVPEFKPPIPPRRKRKRVLKLDEEISRKVIQEHNETLDLRDPRIQMRMARYRKLRGWLPEKSFPWSDSANFWIPLMLIFSLRTKATLENAAKSIRPMMNSKALHRRDYLKQDRIDNLLDYQFFTENDGEKKIDQYISNFVDDEAVFSFVHNVRKEDDYRDIRVLPPAPNDQPFIVYAAQMLPVIFPTMDQERGHKVLDDEGFKWELEFIDQQQERNRARVEFFDREDGKMEAHIAYTAVTFDGPSVEVMDFEDVVFPVRSANLQAPGPENPYGAPWVDRICKTSVDVIKRGFDSGLYDQLTQEDLDSIIEGKTLVGSGDKVEEPKEQKDQLEGVHTPWTNKGDERTVIERYGRYDVDGDGFEEDVIFWIEKSQKKLMKAVYLTEMYPGLPVKRPLNSESFIPVPNRVYGMSEPELIESIQDIMQMLMNQHIDWGTLTNTPFFVYRAASGWKPEVVRIEPGLGIPLDDPERDFKIPAFPTRSESYTINTMTVLQQFAERLSMISDINFGRVPTGKSSAFRTQGATLSILAQGDVRSEQILRRLFHGFGAIYQGMHRLNQRYLPEKKEILIADVEAEGEEIYDDITPDDISGIVDFRFKASLLNTNKQALSGALSEFMALAISPLAIQAGVVTEQEIYTLLRKKAKAADLDPDQILQRPFNFGPKITAEEAISAIVGGDPAVGRTLEPPEEHLAKLNKLEQDPVQFGWINSGNLPLYQAWKQRVEGLVQQRQALIALAQAQAGGSAGNSGPGGVLSQGAGPEATAAPQVQDNNAVGGEFQ